MEARERGRQRCFGKVWRQEPGVRERLGWAVGPERGLQGTAQDFTRGMFLWTGVEQQFVRVYYAAGATLVVPEPNRPP